VYPKAFQWKQDRYSETNSLVANIDLIKKEVARTEEAMKSRFTEVNALRSALDQYRRKTQGTLLVRSMHDIVDQRYVEDTEHLGTIFIVVAKSREEEFLNTYETMVKDWVVPRSYHEHARDGEFVLASIICFKKLMPEFKQKCREQKFQTRDYDADSERSMATESKDRLESELTDRERKLEQWCRNNFSEIYVAWMHIKAVRTFVESVLRFGLPPNYCIAVVLPTAKTEKRARHVLEELYGHLREEFSMHTEADDDEGPPVAGVGLPTTFYPYVCLELNLDLTT